MNTLMIMALLVPFVARPASLEASAVPALLEGVDFQTVGCVDWPSEYPYKPTVQFRIAHSGDAIFVHYKVSEGAVRAVASENNGRVWEDSCVEFFLSPDGNDVYYNFEMNCIGKVLAHFGKVNTERGGSPEAFRYIHTWSSLGSEPFDTEDGLHEWEAAIIIETKALFGHSIDNLGGRTMKANFYKCGDKLPVPHFLSWAPIDLPHPRFHCPEFFGTIQFE